MFCSVKTNEGNDGSASSLSQVPRVRFKRCGGSKQAVLRFKCIPQRFNVRTSLTIFLYRC